MARVLDPRRRYARRSPGPIEPLGSLLAAEALDPGSVPALVRPRSVVARSYPARDTAIRRLLGVADALSVLAGVGIALGVAGYPASHMALYLPVVVIFIVLFKCYGLYDRHVRRISHSWLDEVPRMFHAVLVGAIGVWAATGVLGVDRLRAKPIVALSIAVFVLVPALRVLARLIAGWRLGPERALLVGDDAELDLLARKIRSHPEYQLEAVGFLSHTRTGLATEIPDLGDASRVDLAALVEQHRIGRVLLSRRGLDREAVVDLIRTCNEHRVKVSYLPQVFEGLGPSTEVDDIEGVTLLGLNPPVMTRSSRALKRSTDIIGSLCGLLLTLPLLVMVAVAVKLDSRGPVFFTQSRIGRGGRRFSVIKFRTMVVGAEKLQAELLAKSRDPGWLLLDHDPRITRLGRFLRQSSLDELPQLFNVLKGEMSLVGPRPIIESEDRQLEGWRRSRVDLTPGLTGMWQVLGRTSIPFEEMIKLDYLYVTNWSLWTDVRLMLRTLPAVLARRGVN